MERRATARVAVLCNSPEPSPPEEHWLWQSNPASVLSKEGFLDASEYGVLDEARRIESILNDAGHTAKIFVVDNPAELLSFLQQDRPDVIFNCCESFRGKASGEMCAAGVFELTGIAYTGSPPLTLGMALDKGIAKTLLRANGIPTADFAVCGDRTSLEGDALSALQLPLIVKPVAEDASIGIDANAVVYDEPSLRRRIEFVWNTFRQPALVEEFIDGREFNVALLAVSPDAELMALPISEIVFEELPASIPRIVSYEAKWVPNSPAYLATPPKCPAELDPLFTAHLQNIALRAARTLGLRDYGRVDLRVRKSDNAVFVLEANPNPDITEDSGMARAAAASGRSYPDMIRQILQQAIDRSRAPFADGPGNGDGSVPTSARSSRP